MLHLDFMSRVAKITFHYRILVLAVVLFYDVELMKNDTRWLNSYRSEM